MYPLTVRISRSPPGLPWQASSRRAYSAFFQFMPISRMISATAELEAVPSQAASASAARTNLATSMLVTTPVLISNVPRCLIKSAAALAFSCAPFVVWTDIGSP